MCLLHMILFLPCCTVSKPACDLLLSILGRREVVAENMARVEPAVVVLAEEFRANQVGGATAR